MNIKQNIDNKEKRKRDKGNKDFFCIPYSCLPLVY